MSVQVHSLQSLKGISEAVSHIADILSGLSETQRAVVIGLVSNAREIADTIETEEIIVRDVPPARRPRTHRETDNGSYDPKGPRSSPGGGLSVSGAIVHLLKMNVRGLDRGTLRERVKPLVKTSTAESRSYPGNFYGAIKKLIADGKVQDQNDVLVFVG